MKLLPLVEDNEWFFDTELLVLGERGCPAGWAATPTEKPPMARASSTSSVA